jgi:hypothetical protein
MEQIMDWVGVCTAALKVVPLLLVHIHPLAHSLDRAVSEHVVALAEDDCTVLLVLFKYNPNKSETFNCLLI